MASPFLILSFSLVQATGQALKVSRAHCYHRSALKSTTYVIRDVIAISFLVYGALHIDSFLSRLYVSSISSRAQEGELRADLSSNISGLTYSFAKFVLWFGYTFVTGLFGTGLWIIA